MKLSSNQHFRQQVSIVYNSIFTINIFFFAGVVIRYVFTIINVETDEPTAYPTYPIANEEYQFIENSDLDVISVNSVTYPETNGYFNPGFYNLLRSRFEISLNTQKKRNLFDAWMRWKNYRARSSNSYSYNDTTINMTISVNWYIYDVSNTNNKYLVFSSENDAYTDLINVTAYNEDELQGTTDDTNTTIYTVDAYYALYTGTTVNKYSGVYLQCI